MLRARMPALLSTLALVVATCGTSPSPSPPDQTPAAGAVEFGRILVEGALLRSEPRDAGVVLVSTTGDLDRLVLVLERRTVDDRQWVRVEHWSPGGSARFGWLPAQHDGRPVLGPGFPTCPLDTTDLAAITAINPVERLACFGGNQLRMNPVIARDEGREPIADGDPEWLATETGLKLYGRAGWDSNDVALPLHLDPARPGAIPESKWLEVTGHFDDPASASCIRQQLHEEIPVGSPAEQILWCRQQFVVTAAREVPAPEPTAAPAYDGVAAGRWSAIAPAPVNGRTGHSMVWTGTEMIIWGGEPGPATVDDVGPFPEGDGAAYDPANNAWRVIDPGPLGGRFAHLSTWTGREMLILGGFSRPLDTRLIDGAAYDPATDTWRPISPGPFDGKALMVGAWTGQEWLVVEGITDAGPTKGTVAAYNPTTDRWRRLASVDLPAPFSAGFAWTGSSAVLVANPNEGPSVVFQFDLATNRWIRMGRTPLHGLNTWPATAWTGRELIIPSRAGRDFPGVEKGQDFIVAYDPVTDTWRIPPPPPLGLRGSEPIWTGDRVLFYGYAHADTAVYDPETDVWLGAAPPGDRAREFHSTLWTGEELLIWGGAGGESFLRQPDGLRWTPDG